MHQALLALGLCLTQATVHPVDAPDELQRTPTTITWQVVAVGPASVMRALAVPQAVGKAPMGTVVVSSTHRPVAENGEATPGVTAFTSGKGLTRLLQPTQSARTGV